MVLLPTKDEADAAQADDAGDDADPASVILEMRALFDVRLDESDIAIAREMHARHTRQAGFAQGIASARRDHLSRRPPSPAKARR